LLYADDILLLTPSASSLQLLLGLCVKELEYLDMTINVKNQHACVSAQDIILNAAALQLVMVEKYCGEIRLRYLGVFVTAGHRFSCSLSNAKRSFYRTFHCIFGKVGRVASENVVIELLKVKCLPSLYYGLEACPINKSQIRWLEFVINSSFRKIFSTKSYDVVNECARFLTVLSRALYMKEK